MSISLLEEDNMIFLGFKKKNLIETWQADREMLDILEPLDLSSCLFNTSTCFSFISRDMKANTD